MAGQARGASSPPRTSAPPPQRPGPARGPSRRPRPHQPDRAENARAASAARATGIDERTGDGRTQQDDQRQHDLARPARPSAPRRRPAAPADIAGVAAVPHRPVHVPKHAAGQRRVEELRAVVRRDAAGSGTATPRPRATRLHRQAQHRVVTRAMPAAAASDQPLIDPKSVQERAGAEPPEEDGQDRGPPSRRTHAHADRLIAPSPPLSFSEATLAGLADADLASASRPV